MTTFPLTTTLDHIHTRCRPMPGDWDDVLRGFNKSLTHDTPILYSKILDALGLEAALWCLNAEPQHEQLWYTHAAWCENRKDRASVLADNAQELVSGHLSAEIQNTIWNMAYEEAWDAERQAQADAFRQLVTTGTLP